MKRITKIISILVLCCCLFVSGAAPFVQVRAALTVTAFINEPPDLNSVSYLVLADENNTNPYNSFLFIFSFPLLLDANFTWSNSDAAPITALLDLQSDGVNFTVYCYDLTDVPFYVYVYRLSGDYINSYSFKFPQSGVFNYKFTFVAGRHSYWAKGFITPVISDKSYMPANILWNNDAFINDNLTGIKNLLDSLAELEKLNFKLLYTFFQDYAEYLDWFSNYFLQFGKTTTLQLEDILFFLQVLYKHLGGGDEIPPFDTEDTSVLDDYQNAEDSLMSDYGGQLEGALQYGNNVFASNSAFAFISETIQDLILNNAKLNMIIIFSLGLGLAVLVIGRKINA
ncbi:MAG: hypothetical protein J1E34_03320 [Oscillospiraceae bacterium]|nr:hypothetical protein [Oscillospiraceae bacterium]